MTKDVIIIQSSQINFKMKQSPTYIIFFDKQSPTYINLQFSVSFYYLGNKAYFARHINKIKIYHKYHFILG